MDEHWLGACSGDWQRDESISIQHRAGQAMMHAVYANVEMRPADHSDSTTQRMATACPAHWGHPIRSQPAQSLFTGKRRADDASEVAAKRRSFSSAL